MSTVMIPRPQADEHSQYFGKYIAQVPEGDLIATLRQQVIETAHVLRGLSDERANYAYAPGKWTVKEVVGHLSDVERVMVYRAVTCARGEANAQPGFDENAWVANASFARRSLTDLLDELEAVRASTIAFARTLTAEELARRGTVNGNPATPRALLYIVAGHERHHGSLFRERYQIG